MTRKAMILVLAVVAVVAVIAMVMLHPWSTSGSHDDPSDHQGPSSHSSPVPSPQSAPEGSKFSVTPAQVSEARHSLDTIAVKSKSSMKKYSGHREDLFGAAWTDKATGVDLAGNGCDTRNDILARDLTSVKKKPNCIVESGVLNDPYTGKTINYKRGRTTSSAVQIDHLVPLGNVWASGGESLSQDKRVAIANDPTNLLAVDGPSNGAKSDQDASEWLPQNGGVHCWYVLAQTKVKSTYHLSMTDAEKNAITRVMDTECPH